jgi:hypothetical protein
LNKNYWLFVVFSSVKAYNLGTKQQIKTEQKSAQTCIQKIIPIEAASHGSFDWFFGLQP